MKNNSCEIDFVMTWVDGADPAWRKEKAGYAPSAQNDDREERYRDWDLLRYWFRGVEAFAPWVRKIHFITWGHLPPWLNTEHKKLHVVRHEDYIPKEFLPVFNSNVLEIYMHRIQGLSEHFVYFNDDMFLIRDAEKKLFFHNGKPCDMLAFQPVVANPKNPVMSYLYLNNSLVLCRHFKKREAVKKQPGNYFHIGYPPLYFFYNFLEMAFPLFTGFYTAHGPMPFCKSTFRELWEKEEAVLLETSAHRFRNDRDVTPYLFREWQKLSGNFHPRNICRDLAYFNVDNENQKLKNTIKRQAAPILCINDANEEIEFERVSAEIRQAFSGILPGKSGYEI